MRITLLLFFISLYSCQKSGNGYVKGTVTESATGNPIEGVSVYVTRETREGKGLSTIYYDTIARTLTDASGKFKINYFNSRGQWRETNYVSVGLIKTYLFGNYKKELIYKKTAANFSLY